MNTKQQIKIGQIWEENDPRFKRNVAVIDIDFIDQNVFVQTISNAGYNHRKEWVSLPVGKKSRNNISRFVKHYTLVQK